MSAAQAIFYCREWIESHTLHIYMLHAPDFLGYEGALDMAQHHRQELERGLRLKKSLSSRPRTSAVSRRASSPSCGGA